MQYHIFGFAIEDILLCLTLALVFFALLRHMPVGMGKTLINPARLLGLALLLLLASYVLVVDRGLWPAQTARMLFFTLLYIWCAVGMFFFAPKHHHGAKLYLALVALAGVLGLLYGVTEVA